MPDRKLNLAIIIGTTREGRFGDKVARWFAREAAQHDEYAIDLVDLAEIRLPAVHPKEPTPDVLEFRARLAPVDAFVIVTPEYNHSYPAALKHAIDQVKREFITKPVGFVSYGGIAGGLRAVEHLRNVFVEMHAMTVRDYVSFHMAQRQFDQTGNPTDPDGPRAAAKTMLDRLAWWGHALRNAREARPYV